MSNGRQLRPHSHRTRDLLPTTACLEKCVFPEQLPSGCWICGLFKLPITKIRTLLPFFWKLSQWTSSSGYLKLDYIFPFGTICSHNKGRRCTERTVNHLSRIIHPVASIWGDNLQCISILMIIPTYSEISWQKSRLSEAIVMMHVCICSRECPARTAS